MAPVNEDTRWRFISNNCWQCRNCEESHSGLFDLACGHPDFWQDNPQYQPNSVALKNTHFLSEDFCILNGQHFFIRCVLEIPLIGAVNQIFAFGVWSSLSRKNFEMYRDNFDEGRYQGLGPWFGWFSNRLRGYPDTINLKCMVHPRPERQRPCIELDDVDHPLAIESRKGITFERMVQIYSEAGHPPRLP